MGSVQVIMLVLVFSPVFAERDSYRLARDMLSAVPRETGASEVAEHARRGCHEHLAR